MKYIVSVTTQHHADERVLNADSAFEAAHAMTTALEGRDVRGDVLVITVFPEEG